MKSILLTIVALAVIGGAYLFLQPSSSDASDGSHQEMEIAPTDPSTPWIGPAPLKVAEKFTQAETTAERLKWVRNPARVAPLVEAFFGDGPGAMEEIVDLKAMGPASTLDFAFERFQVKLKDGSSRLLLVILDKDGSKVDFECYARHGSASWPDLLAGKATESDVVRVRVKPVAYYNYAFSDDATWRAFAASSADLKGPLYIYARRDSKEAEQLANFKTNKPARVTLAIRSVEGSHQHRQFEATAVHGRGWVVAYPDDAPES